MQKNIEVLIAKTEAFFNPKNAKWILLFFAVFYGLISFVNHYQFRTSSDPLGIYTNAIYDYAHFRANDCKLLTPLNAELETPFFDNKLSDHFTPIQFLFAPFYYIFGTYTLLIFQWIIILIGGWGVFKFFNDYGDKAWMGSLAMFHYFAFFAFHSALAFDYHDNVLGASALPWLFFFLRKQNWKTFTIIFILALLCKENISIFMFFIFGALALKPFDKSKPQRLIAISASLFSIFYFLTITKVVMPSLANEGRESYLHFHYSALGQSYGDAIKFALTHPWETFKMFFTNHTGDRWGDGIKAELYLVLLLSGAFAWFFRPVWLLMAIPIIAQKVLNDQILKWGINYHYNVELVAICTFAAFFWLNNSMFKVKGLRFKVALLITLSTFTITLAKYKSRTAKWYTHERQNIFSPKHYTRSFDIAELRNALELIPDDEDVSVSGHYHIIPHVAFRETLYEFPVVEDADFIAVLLGEGTYPLKSDDAYRDSVLKYKNSVEWETIYDKNKTVILRRK